MRAAVVGTGVMGSAVCLRLLRAGYQVSVYNRTPGKAAELGAAGAKVAATAAEAIDGADAVVVALLDAGAFRATLLGPEVAPALAGRRVASVTAATPDDMRALAAAVRAHGGTFVEVSVAGTPEMVEQGKAQAFVAGEPADLAPWSEPLRACFARVHDVGALGNASEVENACILGALFTVVGAVYTLRALEGRGVPQQAVAALWENDPFHANGVGMYVLGRVGARSYDAPAATVATIAATCEMSAAYLASLRLPVEPFEAVRGVFSRAVERGFADKDFSAVYEVISPGEA
ncbi:NAD(P)-binding domain-containing protein [Sphaerisporangium sp. TRM90804]|uniref:NAD(P)-binding domain-containing protein n=1 Tax=Sphaerisporangium sp. TRM90804 TaxID=3031113 RepID=UPI00244873B2|nr:NAD(P)-binding domain-containing protein [Sphaerisporangium sp. TRM90804]MDH2429481.1 NAD(P)-binding domain-containing protein [Sphaerisporangium sp. TRM90804]